MTDHDDTIEASDDIATRPGLGLLLPDDHPVSKAAYADPRNWPLSLLMEGVPYAAPPPEYLCPGVRPVALDQDGVGACVAFSGTNLKDTQEKVDQGEWYYDTPSAFVNYDHLKHGWRSFPGDGIPDVEGSYPQAFWELARMEGVVDKQGRPWKVSAWYSHDFRGPTDLDFVQQVIMQFGPVNWGTPWPGNWFNPPTAANDYRMPAPGGSVGGHAYTCIGWKTFPDGVWLTFVNSWGPWGSPQGIFRARADWFYAAPLGPQIVHKIVDFDDPPTPPPPSEGTMKSADATPRYIDCAVGTQFYKADATTPLTKLSSGGTGLYSPCAYDSNNYQVRISTGGVTQIAVVRKADCTNVRPYNDCTAAVAAEHKRWDTWLLTAPK